MQWRTVQQFIKSRIAVFDGPLLAILAALTVLSLFTMYSSAFMVSPYFPIITPASAPLRLMRSSGVTLTSISSCIRDRISEMLRLPRRMTRGNPGRTSTRSFRPSRPKKLFSSSRTLTTTSSGETDQEAAACFAASFTEPTSRMRIS